MFGCCHLTGILFTATGHYRRRFASAPFRRWTLIVLLVAIYFVAVVVFSKAAWLFGVESDRVHADIERVRQAVN